MRGREGKGGKREKSKMEVRDSGEGRWKRMWR